MNVTVEELADLVGDFGLICELKPCRGENHPAIAMIQIHHHCPQRHVKQVYAADVTCVDAVRENAPVCGFCAQDIEVLNIVPL